MKNEPTTVVVACLWIDGVKGLRGACDSLLLCWFLHGLGVGKKSDELSHQSGSATTLVRQLVAENSLLSCLWIDRVKGLARPGTITTVSCHKPPVTL